MLEYDRIGVSEGNASKECNICQCWCFKNIFLSVNHIFAMVCHDLMQKAIDFVDVTIASVKRSDYRSHFWYISKDEAII